MPTTISRLTNWLALFGRGATWIAFAGFYATFVAGVYVRNAVLESAAETGFANIGFQLVGLSLAQLVLWALLLVFLARKLGGGTARTAVALSLLAWVAYYLVGILPSGFLQGTLLARLQDEPNLVAPATAGLSLFWSSAVFPLPVWLVASAHSGGVVGLRKIWAYLTENGTGLWLLFVAFQLASLFVGLGTGRLLGNNATNGTLLMGQGVEALRAIAIVLFYVMAYREIRDTQPPANETFA